LASSGGQIVQPIQKFFSSANVNGCHEKCQEVLEVYVCSFRKGIQKRKNFSKMTSSNIAM
jgi:hypothetical protein